MFQRAILLLLPIHRTLKHFATFPGGGQVPTLPVPVGAHAGVNYAPSVFSFSDTLYTI